MLLTGIIIVNVLNRKKNNLSNRFTDIQRHVSNICSNFKTSIKKKVLVHKHVLFDVYRAVLIYFYLEKLVHILTKSIIIFDKIVSK